MSDRHYHNHGGGRREERGGNRGGTCSGGGDGRGYYGGGDRVHHHQPRESNECNVPRHARYNDHDNRQRFQNNNNNNNTRRPDQHQQLSWIQHPRPTERETPSTSPPFKVQRTGQQQQHNPRGHGRREKRGGSRGGRRGGGYTLHRGGRGDHAGPDFDGGGGRVHHRAGYHGDGRNQLHQWFQNNNNNNNSTRLDQHQQLSGTQHPGPTEQETPSTSLPSTVQRTGQQQQHNPPLILSQEEDTTTEEEKRQLVALREQANTLWVKSFTLKDTELLKVARGWNRIKTNLDAARREAKEAVALQVPKDEMTEDPEQEDRKLQKFIDALHESTIVPHFLLDGRACSCPCSPINEAWREKFDLSFPLCTPAKKKVFKEKAGALMAHFQGIGKTCRYHKATVTYLRILFGNYHVNVGHEYLFAESTKEYRDAMEKAKKEEQCKTERLEQDKRNLKEKLKSQQQVKTKEEINRDAQRQKTLAWLGLDAKNAVVEETVSDIEAETALDHKCLLLQIYLERYLPKCGKMRLCLEAPNHDFDIDVFFEGKCSDTDERDGFALLFRKDKLQDHEFALLIRPPYVTYDNTTGPETIDEGGPTRQLLDTLWNKIPNLTLSKEKNNTMNLLDDRDGVLMLQNNDQLARLSEKQREKAIVCYRFIGRLVVLTLFGAHGMGIPSHFLPRIVWMYLLCGKPPKNKRYDVVNLVFDFYASFPLAKSTEVNATGSDVVGKVLKGTLDELEQYIDVYEDKDAQEDIAPEDQFRSMVHNQFIGGSSIALGALQEGMLPLGTAAGRAMFASIQPVQALEQVCFCLSKLTASDVIQGLNPVYCEGSRKHQEAVLKREDGHVEGYLPKVLQEMEKEKLENFVHFVTGSSHVPQVGFEIKVEFNFDDYAHWPRDEFLEALPHAHTCVRTLKMPGSAYASSNPEGQYATLKTKLTQALENHQGAFTDT